MSEGASNPVSQEEFNRATEKMHGIVVAVILVLVLGFLTLLFQLMAMMNESNQFRAAAYEQLNTHIIELNEKLDKQQQ